MAVPIFTWHLESAGRAVCLGFVARKHASIGFSATNSSAYSKASLPQLMRRIRSSTVKGARTHSSSESLDPIVRLPAQRLACPKLNS